MKRLFIIGTIFFVLFVPLIRMAEADNGIIETPEVKIVIDGRRIEFTDVPLSMNQRTLLPLRELLAGLGVENDDAHIFWDGSDRSVTVNKDDVRVYLKIGDKNAYVNGKQEILDVEPIGYTNQRIYIPARFVSQAFGNKVVWDGNIKSVLIREESGYRKVEEILERACRSMETLKRFRINVEAGISMLEENSPTDFKGSMSVDIDKANEAMHIAMSIPYYDKNLSYESCITGGTEYRKDPFGGEWRKADTSGDAFEKAYAEYTNLPLLKDNEILKAGLAVEDTSHTGITVLEGYVYPGKILDSVIRYSGVEKYEADNYCTKILVNSYTGLIENITVILEGKLFYGDGRSTDFKSTVCCIYGDFNSKFEIKAPEGLE